MTGEQEALAMDNHAIAQELIAHAGELERDEGNLYRVKAYRRAAETVLGLDRPVAEVIARHGRKGLEALPGIGTHLAYTIEHLVRTGELCTLTPDAVAPEQRVCNVPSVGAALTELLATRLGVVTIQELEAAARDGHLDQLGLGIRRTQKLRAALAKHRAEGRPAPSPTDEPPVAELLELDAEYRRQAEAGQLPTLSPRRHNPEQEAWLPILHTRRDGWRCRVLFSNTALAHRLRRTRDWVVIYFTGEQASGQRTVVTETRGDLHGLRVVRGREAECRAYYRHSARASRTAPSVTVRLVVSDSLR
jgi:hypothetical protein